MNFTPLRLAVYLVFNVGILGIILILVLQLAAQASVSNEAFWTSAIVLGIGLLLLSLIAVGFGLVVAVTLTSLRREFGGATIYRAVPYEGFAEMVSEFSTVPIPIVGWDTYMLVDDEYLSFLSGAKRIEILTVRRDQVLLSTAYYFGWISIFPVLRLSIPGLHDAAIALPIARTFGLLNHSSRFMRRVVIDPHRAQPGARTA